MLRTDLTYNGRKLRLEGTLLGVENALSGRGVAYQGELLTGEITTVYWDGTARYGSPVLRSVDTGREVSGDPYAWRWFARLADVVAA